jgi:hypothetical protein
MRSDVLTAVTMSMLISIVTPWFLWNVGIYLQVNAALQPRKTNIDKLIYRFRKYKLENQYYRNL